MHLGYLGPNPVSLFFLRWGKCDKWLLLSMPHGVGGGGSQHLLDCRFRSSPFNIWRPEIADGCDISCLLIWQEIFSFYSCYLLLPGTFLTQWWNSSLLHLLHCRQILYHWAICSQTAAPCVSVCQQAGRWLRMSREIGAGPSPSTLAWKITWMEEPGRLQSMGS